MDKRSIEYFVQVNTTEALSSCLTHLESPRNALYWMDLLHNDLNQLFDDKEQLAEAKKC